MSKYFYQCVAGAGVFGEMTTLKIAKSIAAYWRPRFRHIEIERVLLLDNNARRYWRWRSGKWSTKNHYDPAPGDLAKWADRSTGDG